MKWLWIIVALAFLLAGYVPYRRTHYTPLPAIARVKRRVWAFQRPRWAIAVAIVRLA